MINSYFGGFTDIDVNKYPTLVYAEAQATANTTTTSGTYTALNGMSITPLAGVYMVWFSCSHKNDGNGAVTNFAVHVNGSIVQHSERQSTSYIAGLVVGNAPQDQAVATQCLVSVNGSQTIEVRWNRTSGTSTCYERTMTVLKMANL